MDLLENGTLKELGPFKTDEEAALMSTQILDATLYLHVQGYTHRDIKPDNILVKSVSPLMLQLSDFGFTSRNTLTTFCGTHVYAAPEIYAARNNPNTSYSSAVDIWAVGAVMLEYHDGLCSIPQPFDPLVWCRRLAELLTAMQSRPRLTAPSRLAHSMLNPIPEERPLAQTCLTVSKAILRSKSAQLLAPNRNRPVAADFDRSSRMTKQGLCSWVNLDPTKTPSAAINLTKICSHLAISRDVYRARLRKEPYYIVRGTGRVIRGTYVSIDFAREFLKQKYPKKDIFQNWLHDIAASVQPLNNVPAPPTEAPVELPNLPATAAEPGAGDPIEPATCLSTFSAYLDLI
jgi:serine/threonine protein kinase